MERSGKVKRHQGTSSVIIGAMDPANLSTIQPSSTNPPGVIAPNLAEAAQQVGGVGAISNGNKVGCCGEFNAANQLMLNNPNLKPGEIRFTPAISPRTGQVIDPCPNCKAIFNLK